MVLFFVLAVGCFTGFILFSRILLKEGAAKRSNKKISVIIPARNEEKNLPYILKSLQQQTLQPDEVIVVNDFSVDFTKQIATEYGATVIDNSELPEGWTGKTWAVWNGFQHSTGDILVFLDADIRLAPNALASLVAAREKSGGAISTVPYHYTEKFYERLALVTNILGIFAFTSPFERYRSAQGLYGSCIVCERQDYEKIGGHSCIKSELMDDLNLGKKFAKAGIKVENFIGHRLVSFRMYPNGLKSEIEGFGKGATLGAATLRPKTLVLVILWILGLIVSGLGLPIVLLAAPAYALPFLLGYLLYTFQIFYFVRYVGKFGFAMPVLHVVSTLFFLLFTLYSVYQVNFLGYVTWKGRHIDVGGKK